MKPNLYGFGDSSYGVFGEGDSGNKYYYIKYLQDFKQIFARSTSYYPEDYIFFGLTNKGQIIAFGENFYGQMGANSVVNIYNPYPLLVNNYIWEKFYTDGLTVHALDKNGFWFAWGGNPSGEVPSGQTGTYITPVKIGNEKWIDFISNKAIRYDGKLFAWGFNNGQIGDGTVISRSSPVQIGNDTWSKIFSRGAIRSDGKLFTWGSNSNGVLGDGTVISRSSPVQIGNDTWITASSNGFVSAAIRSDGLLFTWGDGSIYGELGTGDRRMSSSPVQIGNSIWKDVVVLTDRICLAIDSNDNLFGWGLAQPDSFLFGTPNSLNRSGTFFATSSPVQIGTKKIKKIISNSLFIDINDKVVSRSETLFLPKEVNRYRDTVGQTVRLTNKTFKKISSSQTFGGIDHDNNLFLWGNNTYGQVGNNSIGIVSRPFSLNSSKYKDISCSEENTFAIREDGLLFAWGYNVNGQLGDGTIVARSSPVQIGNSKWKALSSYCESQGASVAIRDDGALFIWGRNTSSGLFGIGLSTESFRSSPVQLGSESWNMVHSTTFNIHAIRSDGLLFGWGAGSIRFVLGGLSRTPSGMIGDNAAVSRSSPVQIGTKSWKMVSGSLGSVVAIDSDGYLFQWGGITPDSSFVSRFKSYSSPVQIGTKKWKFVNSNRFTNFAIDEDDFLYVWGAISALNRSSLIITNFSEVPVKFGEKKWKQVCGLEGPFIYQTILGADSFIGLTKE